MERRRGKESGYENWEEQDEGILLVRFQFSKWIGVRGPVCQNFIQRGESEFNISHHNTKVDAGEKEGRRERGEVGVGGNIQRFFDESQKQLI